MRDLYKGSKRNISKEVRRRVSTPFTLENAYVTITNVADEVVQEGIATIDDSKIIFLVDTTLEGFKHEREGRANRYTAWFQVEVEATGKLLLDPMNLRVLKGVES